MSGFGLNPGADLVAVTRPLSRSCGGCDLEHLDRRLAFVETSPLQVIDKRLPEVLTIGATPDKASKFYSLFRARSAQL
jgi:hypothetical protein